MKYSILTLWVCLMITPGIAGQEFTQAELTGKRTVYATGDLAGLQPEVIRAFEEMAAAAAEEGIELKAVSGFRSYDRQLKIWNTKYKEYRAEGLTPIEAVEKIIEYSTIPGTSRHHWGTDLDIIDESADETENVLNPDKFKGEGSFAKMKAWMDEHAAQYGFFLVYTDDPWRSGFKHEPWHYSYAPISVKMLKAYRALDILEVVENDELLGRHLLDKAFMERYKREQLLSINKDLLE